MIVKRRLPAQTFEQQALATEQALAQVGEEILIVLHNALIDDDGEFNPDQLLVERTMARLEDIFRASDAPAVQQLMSEIEPGD